MMDASTNAPVGTPVTVGNTPIVLGVVGGTPSTPPCDDQLASLRQ